jgi:hypothetical protein
MTDPDLLVECAQGFVPGWTKNSLVKSSPLLASYLIKNEDRLMQEHKLYTPEGNVYWLLDQDKLAAVIQEFYDNQQ